MAAEATFLAMQWTAITTSGHVDISLMIIVDDILLAQCALTLYLFYLYLRQSLWSAAKALRLRRLLPTWSDRHFYERRSFFFPGRRMLPYVHSFSSEVQMSVDIFRMKNALLQFCLMNDFRLCSKALLARDAMSAASSGCFSQIKRHLAPPYAYKA